MSRTQVGGIVAAIVAAHLALGWGLMQIQAVREVVAGAAPMMFEVMAEPKPEPAPPPPKPITKVVQPVPLIAAKAQEATPSDFVVPLPEPETPVVSSAAVEVQSASEPAAAPPAPKMLPPSAIQYLVPPVMEYPRASRRLREGGRVIVRVYVDESGMPRTTQISKSSGFERIDEAGIAAVQKARFKPYTENGRPTAGWALIPLNFEVE